MLTGENGILTQAQNASEQTQIAEEEEAISLAMQSLLIDKQLNPDNYENGIINAAQLRTEMDKSNPKPTNVSLDNTTHDLTVTFDESRNNRTYTVGQDGTIEEQQPVETTSFYAKLYTYTDGSGDVLELSSNPDFTDTSGNVTLKEDYGDIGANHYYLDITENYTENEYYYEETGLMPPWFEKTTEEYEDDGYKQIAVYYAPKGNIIDVKIVDMSEMFSGCSGLTTLDVSNFDTSNVTDMSGMFSEYSGLTTLDVSNFDTSNVTDMSGMFSGYSGLTTLDVSNFDTSNVTDMSGMFWNCTNLTTINLNGWNTSNVENMRWMFDNCNKLTTLDVSELDTDNATNMEYMFGECRDLTDLDVSNFNTINVTNMYGMFGNCESLTKLDLSSFNTKNVTDMRRMFCGCEKLINLNVSNFDTSNVIRMGGDAPADGMFYKCTSLKELDLSSFDTRNVTNMRAMFSNCQALKIIYVGANWTTVQADTSNMFNGCGISSVTPI